MGWKYCTKKRKLKRVELNTLRATVCSLNLSVYFSTHNWTINFCCGTKLFYLSMQTVKNWRAMEKAVKNGLGQRFKLAYYIWHHPHVTNTLIVWYYWFNLVGISIEPDKTFHQPPINMTMTYTQSSVVSLDSDSAQNLNKHFPNNVHHHTIDDRLMDWQLVHREWQQDWHPHSCCIVAA